MPTASATTTAAAAARLQHYHDNFGDLLESDRGAVTIGMRFRTARPTGPQGEQQQPQQQQQQLQGDDQQQQLFKQLLAEQKDTKQQMRTQQRELAHGV